MSDANISAKAGILVRRPVAEVFVAFVDAGNMSRFWFTRKDDGLKEGVPVTFYMGPEEGAFSFEVQVKVVNEPRRIVMEWEGPDGNATQVSYSFDETEEGETILTIEETGFAGSAENQVAQALNSTGGFNQVVVAAKAFIEHGIVVNVVADHA